MVEMCFKVTADYGRELQLELIPAPQEHFYRVFIWDLEGDGPKKLIQKDILSVTCVATLLADAIHITEKEALDLMLADEPEEVRREYE